MRKHNEGYSLVLVLVVLVVICLVAAFILSFSLNNLRSQQASVERMQDRYAAAGEIEKIEIQLKEMIDPNVVQQSVRFENADVAYEDKMVTYAVTSGTVRIDVTFCLIAERVEPINEETKEYRLTNCTGVEYVSYQISTVSEEVTE